MSKSQLTSTNPLSLRRRAIVTLLFALAVGPALAALGGDFALTRADGAPFSSQMLRGKVVVLSFGYTSCPDVCPTTLNTVSVLLRTLGHRAKQVAPVFISVDPQRDQPGPLRQYLSYFHRSIIGLTGTETQLQSVARQFGTFIRYHTPNETGAYQVDHSGSIYIIDREGHLRRVVPYGMPLEQLVESVEAVLDMPAPSPVAGVDPGTP